MNSKTKGILAILCANTIFGLNIPVTKALVSGWMTPTGYTLIRMLFGSLVFWFIGLLRKSEKVTSKDMLIMALGGFLGFVATQFTFALALQYTTPVNFALMMALTPVIVLVLSFLFLKEKIGWKKLLGISMSVSGAALIILYGSSSAQGRNDLLGIAIALICALSYAAYMMLTRNVSVKYGPVTVVKWMFLFAFLIILPFGSGGVFQLPIFGAETEIPAIGLLVFSLIFSTLIAFFLMPVALGRLKASTVSIFMNLQPIAASVVAIIIGQDFFSWDKVLATLLVIGGVYMVTQTTSNK